VNSIGSLVLDGSCGNPQPTRAGVVVLGQNHDEGIGT
jgi:hypothetical protein